MIDKITPRPDDSVETILKKDGLEELEPVVTSKNTYILLADDVVYMDEYMNQITRKTFSFLMSGKIRPSSQSRNAFAMALCWA